MADLSQTARDPSGDFMPSTGGAAFGFFPQMQPRRQGLPSDSANLPIDVLRGRIAGLFGFIPDMLNFMGRSPMPTETFGETQYEPRPQLPYDTEFYLKNLPLAPTSRAGQVAGQAASFVPLNPAPAIRAGVAGAQALAPTAARMTEGFMQRQGFMPSVVPAQPSGLLTPEIPAPKPQAPVSDLGFYSAAEQAAMNLQRGKGTGQSFLNDLMKAPDVKKDELQYTGLDEFLKDKPNVTRQEVQDFIAGNRVDVQEVKLSGKADSTRPFVEWSPSEQNYLVYADDEIPLGTFNTSREAEKYISDNFGKPTQYGKYQLPGGENYRELLLTLPAKRLNENEARKVIGARPDAKLSEADISYASRKAVDEYKSSHFDEPNILAHMRVNDRIDADGKKMLLVEEIQSDWHQAGREKGYKGQFKDLPNDYKIESKTDKDGYSYYEVLDPQGNVFAKDYSKGSVTNQAINRLNETIGGVPDAPFKDTWYQLSLKRILKYAADNGYERVGLTTGKQQADRYKLSNEVDEINVTGRTNMATGEKSKSVALDLTSGTQYRLGVDNNGVIDNVNDADIANFKGKKLSEVVGKDIAKQIMEGNSQTIKGEGLNIGGEGMKKYYDEIYPKFLEKYGKKWDAKVGETKVNTVMQRADNSMIPQMGQEPIRYIDITPKMKESVSKGQPLFAAAPVGTLGLGGLEYADPFGNLFPQQPQPQQSAQPIFEKPRTWDAAAAQKAKMLEDMGTDPKTIWQQTGTWKGPDGKWRQEVMQ